MRKPHAPIRSLNFMAERLATMRITGTGRFLPDHSYSTEEVAKMLGAGEEALEHYGIEERRWAGELDPEAITVDPGPLGPDAHRTMAVRAAECALADGGIDGDDVDRVDTLILCSCTQPIEGARFATAATGVQHDLGLSKDTHTIEVTGGSASSMYALQSVERCLKSGDRNVLLVAVNAAANHLDPIYRELSATYTSTIFIFGDGAGAFLFSGAGTSESGSRAVPNASAGASSEDGPSGGPEDGCRVLAHVHERLESRRCLIANEVQDGKVLYRINLSTVARSVLRGIPDMIEKLAEAFEERGEENPPEPDYYLLHQANSRLLEKLVQRMDVPPERVLSDVRRFGNLGPAEPLVLLDRMLDAGKLSPGDRVLIATVGGGQQRSAVLVEV